MKIGILLSRVEPDSRLVLEIRVEMVNIEVTTRPLHLFSFLVEFLKGVEYFQILPPLPPYPGFGASRSSYWYLLV